MMCRHCTGLKGTQGADSAGQDIWDANLVQSTRDVDLAQCKRTFGVQSMCRARWHSSCQPQCNAVWQLGCRCGNRRRSLGCRSCAGEEDTGYIVGVRQEVSNILPGPSHNTKAELKHLMFHTEKLFL